MRAWRWLRLRFSLKAQLEAELRDRLASDARHGVHTFWVRRDWLEELGRDRVQQIVTEFGFGPLKPSFHSTSFSNRRTHA